jgi:hypothetical protein
VVPDRAPCAAAHARKKGLEDEEDWKLRITPRLCVHDGRRHARRIFLGQAESEELDRSFLRLLRGGTVMGVGGFAKQDFGTFLVASLL